MSDLEVIEICPGCGRRSSQNMGVLCRSCTFNTPEPGEREAFEALCQRQSVKMSDYNIYFRRRKNALKTAAIAMNRKVGVTDKEERLRLLLRKERALDHFILLDEIWNYLNPLDRFVSDWGKTLEVLTAAKALKNGTFDAFCKEAHVPRKLRKEI